MSGGSSPPLYSTLGLVLLFAELCRLSFEFLRRSPSVPRCRSPTFSGAVFHPLEDLSSAGSLSSCCDGLSRDRLFDPGSLWTLEDIFSLSPPRPSSPFVFGFACHPLMIRIWLGFFSRAFFARSLNPGTCSTFQTPFPPLK